MRFAETILVLAMDELKRTSTDTAPDILGLHKTITKAMEYYLHGSDDYGDMTVLEYLKQ